MEKCEKCLYYKNKEKCGECGRLSNVMDNYPMFTPNTNYDRIKSMSVEEMASFICGIYDGYDDYLIEGYKFICGDVIPDYYDDKIKQWLLQEVIEGEQI